MGSNFFVMWTNPFENLTDRKLIVVGLISFCILVCLEYLWGFKSIGLFHLSPAEHKSVILVLFNKSVNLAVLTLVFYGFGKLLNRKTRLLDIFIVVLVAQMVFLLVVIPLCNPYVSSISESIENSLSKGDITLQLLPKTNLIILTVAALISLAALVYYVYLIIKGLRIAVNSKRKYHGLVIVLLLFAVDIFLSAIKPYL